jgi:hypothetical protein
VKLNSKGIHGLRPDAWNHFQRDCPDVRNTKIVDVIALSDYGITVTI